MKALLYALLIAAPFTIAAEQLSAQQSAVATRSSSGADPLEAVAWLAGRWIGEGLGGRNETLWSPPDAGSMMGVYRHIKDDRVVFYEFLTLTVRADTLVLALKHFHSDMTGWEEPTESVRFPLLRVEADAVYFDGMMYRREGSDQMEVTVMLGPDADHLRPEVFTFRRVRP